MAITHLKRASRTPEDTNGEARSVVETMLADIALRGEAAVCEHAARLDHWTGEILVTADEIDRRIQGLPLGICADIDFAVDRVRRFALAQRASIQDFSIELSPGVIAGQRLVPVQVAGC